MTLASWPRESGVRATADQEIDRARSRPTRPGRRAPPRAGRPGRRRRSPMRWNPPAVRRSARRSGAPGAGRRPAGRAAAGSGGGRGTPPCRRRRSGRAASGTPGVVSPIPRGSTRATVSPALTTRARSARRARRATVGPDVDDVRSRSAPAAARPGRAPTTTTPGSVASAQGSIVYPSRSMPSVVARRRSTAGPGSASRLRTSARRSLRVRPRGPAAASRSSSARSALRSKTDLPVEVASGPGRVSVHCSSLVGGDREVGLDRGVVLAEQPAPHPAHRRPRAAAG